MDAAAAEPKLMTLSASGLEEAVTVHPCSVNYGKTAWSSRWLVYHERVQTSSIFVRDCTPVSPMQLLLLGGLIDVRGASGTITIDKWMTFTASPVTAAMVREARSSLDAVLAAKISNPRESLESLGGAIVPAILSLLVAEFAAS